MYQFRSRRLKWRGVPACRRVIPRWNRLGKRNWSVKRNPASRAPRARSARKRVLTAKPLVESKIFTSNTPVKIQFWLLGAIFGSKFAKITDRDIAILDISLNISCPLLNSSLLYLKFSENGRQKNTLINMWSRRSAIERCPSPRNQIRFCPIVTDNGPVKGNDIYRFSIFRA